MRNIIKENSHQINMSKKGQIGLFVIMAIVILAIIIAFLLFRGIKLPGIEDTATPQQYISSCLEPVIEPLVGEIARQGGYLEPEGFIVYNDTKLPYLSDTSEYVKPCVIQQPDIIGNFERPNPVLLKNKNSALRLAAFFGGLRSGRSFGPNSKTGKKLRSNNFAHAAGTLKISPTK